MSRNSRNVSLTSRLSITGGLHCTSWKSFWLGKRRISTSCRIWLKKRGDYYLKAAKAQFDGTGRNLSQIHERFSTIYAAGRLAQRFEILPWTPNKLRKALLACEQAHIELTQRAPQQISRETPLQRLQAYVQKHKADFPKLKKSSPATHGKSSSAPGYRNTHAGKLEYLFTKSQFNQIAGGASLAQALKSELKERGWIESTGKFGSYRYAVKRALKGGRRPYFVAISPKVVD